jgi:catechol 2,3-dioxygenase-like lactoylglutathione lyase family enzyme
MDNFYARTVFFVRDAEAALAFYTQTLGFGLDWNYQYESRACVFEVSLFGFELILNQVFEAKALCEHIRAKGIQFSRDDWGKPTLVIKDMDGNELFFWVPEGELASLESENPAART